MYVCGMTVYDLCHLGHARVMVVFDMVTRYLRYSGYDVTYVRNITDIDDKIIRRANDNGETIQQLTERFIAAMHDDERTLGVLPPDEEPKATKAMPMRRVMATSIMTSASLAPTDNYPAKQSTSCALENALRLMNTKMIHWTLYCGKPQNPASLHGIQSGVRADQAGISNVRRWRSAV